MTHVFADNLLERRSDTLPWENLDVLLNVPWFGLRESHDGPEKGIGRRLVLGNSLRSETFQVSSDPVLFLDRESLADNGFEEVQHVDRGDPTRVLVFSEHARNNDTFLFNHPLGLGERTESEVDDSSFLSSPDLDQSSLGSPLFGGPTLGHGSHIASNTDFSFGGVVKVHVGASGKLARSHQLRLKTGSQCDLRREVGVMGGQHGSLGEGTLGPCSWSSAW
jgi:hypothetical protein